MKRIDITSAQWQRTIRNIGLVSGGASLILAICAYATLYHRGLVNTGVLLLLCTVNLGLGWFGFTQQAFPRDSILFGLIPASRKHDMAEPGWSLGSALGAIILAVLVITTMR